MFSPVDSSNFHDDPTLGINLQPLTTTYVEVEGIESDIKRVSSMFYEETVHLSYKLPKHLKKSRNFLQPYLDIKHSKLNYRQVTISIDLAKVFVEEYIACFGDNVGINNLLEDILHDMDRLKKEEYSNPPPLYGIHSSVRMKGFLFSLKEKWNSVAISTSGALTFQSIFKMHSSFSIKEIL
ncbi:hypothetical protein ACTFIR_011498 [Dictyostelium discoideum]